MKKNKATASVIIPAYNEEKNIGQVIDRIRKVGNYEIIVVDDGSKDSTGKIAKEKGVITIMLEKNLGKGRACLEGAKRASQEKLIFIDADLQLLPEEIPKMEKALDSCDLAIGARNMDKIPLQRRIANNVARKLVASDQNFSDVLCGFRAIKKKALLRMKLENAGYEFESEMIICGVKNKMKIKEVPVSVNYESCKGMGMLDSAKLLLYILKKRRS